MDAITLGAALLLIQKRLDGLDTATQEAQRAANAANTAAGKATSAAQAAEGWQTLADNDKHILAAMNLFMTATQAEVRELKKLVSTMQSQISALSS